MVTVVSSGAGVMVEDGAGDVVVAGTSDETADEGNVTGLTA